MAQCIATRSFNHAEAREAFRVNTPISVLIQRFAVTRSAIYAAMSDADRLARKTAASAEKAVADAGLVERARQLRFEGVSQTAIARELRISRDRVTAYTCGVKPKGWLPPRPAATPGYKVSKGGVPNWVQRHALTEDYRDHLRLFGPYDAARHCRRLIAEMRSGPA